ncbi:MAG TPA: M23 family metallopeptidase [Bacteroidales bacterium]|nr:M23 family metallopeptidase [Bacteroidales bacterium]
MVYKRPLLMLLMLFVCKTFTYAQKVLPENYFRSPLDINLVVTGTFGELRPDHFHSGIDFATQNKLNANVYCVADGYVSRIKVSPGGYGKVLYITHPNGFVSVYAHLNEFNVVIEDYVKLKQYEKKSFEIEIFPNPALFKFKKGDIAGYSGNSGSSSGPHLHFEIRNEITERPFNPLFFGINPSDKESPVISEVCLYPVFPNSIVNEGHQKICLDAVKKENRYCLKTNDTISLSGGIAFGIETSDRQNLPGNSGIYSLEIFIDNHLFYKISFDSIDFDEGRYINTLIDYPEYVINRKKIIQTYITRGNRLNIYAESENRGVYYFNDTLLHKISMIASDFYKNKASIEFTVKSAVPEISEQAAVENKLPLFRYGLKNHFEAENMLLDMPSDALYDSIYFEYSTMAKTKYCYSKIHQIHHKFVPLHNYITLSIKPDTVVSENLKPKLTLACIAGTNFSFIKSKWENGYLSASVRKFGDYAIVADTVAPTVKPMANYNNMRVNPEGSISFKISDNFSGIGTYNLSINGVWVLAAYDAKNDLLTYKVDSNHFSSGKNVMELVVTDKINNKSTYNAVLIK